jgi:8-oxo-dGTP diphosphatase
MRSDMDDLPNKMIRVGYCLAYVALRAWWFLVRPQTHGSCVALWHGGKVLMVRTSYRDCYSLPGGFVRRQESAEQAARRELLEELGIDLHGQPLRLAWSGTLPFECRSDSVEIWQVSVEQTPEFRVSGREITWAGWLTPDEALKLCLLPHVAEYLAERGMQNQEVRVGCKF